MRWEAIKSYITDLCQLQWKACVGDGDVGCDVSGCGDVSSCDNVNGCIDVRGCAWIIFCGCDGDIRGKKKLIVWNDEWVVFSASQVGGGGVGLIDGLLFEGSVNS